MRKTLLTLVCLALLLPSLLHFVQVSRSFANGVFYDLPLFVNAALRHERGEPVYERPADLQDRYKPGAMVFKFPPPYLFFFLPWFDASGAWPAHFNGAWAAVSGLLFAGAVVLSCALVFRAGGQPAFMATQQGCFVAFALAAACWFVPYLHVLGATSAENFIMAMVVLAFAVMLRWPLLSGALLAWLACIKLYPAFLLVYPLLLRQWRVLAAAGVTGMLVCAASWWVFGTEEIQFYLTRVLPILLAEPVSEDWTDPLRHPSGNLNIVKVLVSYGWLPNRNAEWLNAVRLPLVAVMLYCLWRVRELPVTAAWPRLLAYALVVVTMMACLPNFYFPYFTMMAFPLVVLAGWLVQRRQGWCLLLLALPVSTLWLDDAWTVALATAGGLTQPTPAMEKLVETQGLWPYLWQYHPLLWWCMVGGRLVPFVPYLLWFALAAVLLVNLPGRSLRSHPSSGFSTQ